MRALFVSFAVGLGVGVLYGLLRVKSPAPPIVALLGLLGMVIGEQVGTWLHTTKLDVSQAASVSLLGEVHGVGLRAALSTGKAIVALRLAVIACLLLVGFLAPATVVAHRFWSATGDAQVPQLINFIKNVAIIWGLLSLASIYGSHLPNNVAA